MLEQELSNASESNASESVSDALSMQHPILAAKYHDMKRIGAGAQGTMIKALDSKDQPVAIKIFDLRTAPDLKSIELFEREIETLQSINCKGVPKFIDKLPSDQFIYLVEEYVPAVSLAELMAKNQRMSFEDIETIFVRSAEILKTLGSYVPPVIHRDIKPGNLLVDEHNNVYLVDFGVVADIRNKSTDMTFAGTAGYLAPEQLYGKVTPSSDVFALGMTLLHFITHVSPCDMECGDLEPKIDDYIPDNIPPWFVYVLKNMICHVPSKRLQNGAELLSYYEQAKTSSMHGGVIEMPDQLPDSGHSESHSDSKARGSIANAQINNQNTVTFKLELDGAEEALIDTHASSRVYLDRFFEWAVTVPAIFCAFLFVIYWFFCVIIFDYSYMGFFSYCLAAVIPIMSIVFGCGVWAQAPASGKKYRNAYAAFVQAADAVNSCYIENAKEQVERVYLSDYSANRYNTIKTYNYLMQLKFHQNDYPDVNTSPLTSEERARLVKYKSDDSILYPCLSYKPDFQFSFKLFCTRMIPSLFYIGLTVFVWYVAGTPSEWNTFNLVVLGFYSLANLVFWIRFFGAHRRRSRNKNSMEAYQLCVREFLNSD